MNRNKLMKVLAIVALAFYSLVPFRYVFASDIQSASYFNYKSIDPDSIAANLTDASRPVSLYNYFIYESANQSTGHNAIYAKNINGSGPATLICDNAQHPSVGRSTELYYSKYIASGDYDIVIYDLATMKETKVIAKTGVQDYPSGSENAGVAYVDYSGGQGNDNVYVYDDASNSEKAVATGTGDQTWPNLTSFGNGAYQIVYNDFSLNVNSPDAYYYNYTGSGNPTNAKIADNAGYPKIHNGFVVYTKIVNNSYGVYGYSISRAKEYTIIAANDVYGGTYTFPTIGDSISDLSTNGFTPTEAHTIALTADNGRGGTKLDLMTVFFESNSTELKTAPDVLLVSDQGASRYPNFPQLSNGWLTWTAPDQTTPTNTLGFSYNLKTLQRMDMGVYQNKAIYAGYLDGKHWQIYSQDLSTNEVTKLTDTGTSSDNSDHLNPLVTGGKVFYTVMASQSGNTNIYSIDLNNTSADPVKITNDDGFNEIITANGDNLLCSHHVPQTFDGNKMWVYNVKTNTRTDLLASSGKYEYGSSISGDLVGYIGSTAGDSSKDVYLYNMKTDENLRLTNTTDPAAPNNYTPSYIQSKKSVFTDDSKIMGWTDGYDVYSYNVSSKVTTKLNTIVHSGYIKRNLTAASNIGTGGNTDFIWVEVPFDDTPTNMIGYNPLNLLAGLFKPAAAFAATDYSGLYVFSVNSNRALGTISTASYASNVKADSSKVYWTDYRSGFANSYYATLPTDALTLPGLLPAAGAQLVTLSLLAFLTFAGVAFTMKRNKFQPKVVPSARYTSLKYSKRVRRINW